VRVYRVVPHEPTLADAYFALQPPGLRAPDVRAPDARVPDGEGAP
jgi:hypothetical protein